MTTTQSTDFSYIVFDTEDNSRELQAKADKSKRRLILDKGRYVTQIAAVTSDGAEYYEKAKNPSQARRITDDFHQWLLQRPEKYIYAHNLQYDLGNILGDRLDSLYMTMVGGRVIKAKWNGKFFVDTFNLFPTSVAKLGEAFGLSKLEMDEHSKEYVMRDCEIPALALAKLTELCREFGLVKPSTTLGGLCVAIWKAMGGENWHDSAAFTRSAIYGGRVELFSKGGTGSIQWHDINSLYPWSMTQKFPAGMIPVKKMLKYGVTKATVFVPDQFLAPLPYRAGMNEFRGVAEGSILFPCGRMTGVWTNAELVNAMEHHGVKIEKIHESQGTNEGRYFYREFVNEFYQRRLESESEAYKLIYKLLMNNLFGQLGMGGEITKTVRATPDQINALRSGAIDGCAYGDNLMITCTIPLPPHVNHTHAAYVTALGRIRLLEYLRAIPEPEKNLIYCDTDSVFFFHDPAKPLPYEVGKELGVMKIEGVGDQAITFAPKMYEITTAKGKTSKAKGVPRKLAAEFIAERTVQYFAPFKMRESITFYDRAIAGQDADENPLLVPRKAGRARPLSTWRKVSKDFRTEYVKKGFKEGIYHPINLQKKDLTKEAKASKVNK